MRSARIPLKAGCCRSRLELLPAAGQGILLCLVMTRWSIRWDVALLRLSVWGWIFRLGMSRRGQTFVLWTQREQLLTDGPDESTPLSARSYVRFWLRRSPAWVIRRSSLNQAKGTVLSLCSAEKDSKGRLLMLTHTV